MATIFIDGRIDFNVDLYRSVLKVSERCIVTLVLGHLAGFRVIDGPFDHSIWEWYAAAIKR